MGSENIFAFGALICLLVVVIRGRIRVRCLEAQLTARPAKQVRKEMDDRYNDNRMVGLVDLCRELEARVQNRALLLETLIDDADERIAKAVGSSQPTATAIADPAFKTAFCSAVASGQSDEALSLQFKRPVLTMTLLRDLWRPTP